MKRKTSNLWHLEWFAGWLPALMLIVFFALISPIDLFRPNTFGIAFFASLGLMAVSYYNVQRYVIADKKKTRHSFVEHSNWSRLHGHEQVGVINAEGTHMVYYGEIYIKSVIAKCSKCGFMIGLSISQAKEMELNPSGWQVAKGWVYCPDVTEEEK